MDRADRPTPRYRLAPAGYQPNIQAPWHEPAFRIVGEG